MSEDMEDEELEEKDEALEIERAGGKDQASETGETEETEASNDIPETQKGTPNETEETEETGESTGQAPVGEKGERKGLFKRKKDPRDKKIEGLTDRVKRQMAEFGNSRKRIDKEKFAMYGVGAKDIIEGILPVTDNFERDLTTVPEGTKETPLAEDMERIYKQLRKTLEEAGVRATEAVNQEFDPSYHNAMIHVDNGNLGENIVAKELQKDYTYRDGVVRHSIVKVAN